MNKETKGLLGSVIAIVVLLACFYGILRMDANETEKDLWNKIRSYDTIIINCEEYNTQDVIEITTESSFYKNGTTIFKMKDGTETAVTGENWTFKNK